MINQIVNGKEINFDLLEEHFGKELADSIKEELDYATKRYKDWKIEVLDDDKYNLEFSFVTNSHARVFEYWKTGKEIKKDHIIGFVDCEKLLKAMNSLDKVEIKG